MRLIAFISSIIIMLIPSIVLSADIGDDGLYDSPIFYDSFLDLAEDAAIADADGKILMLVIEQRGCPYCREMHEVNFARDDIRAMIAAKFYPVQLDLWGSREVTNFDGTPLEEREFVELYNIQFTPTTIFLSKDGEELFRMPGYFKPFHHLSGLEFVASEEYQRQSFQRFLQDKFQKLQAEGIDPNVWE